jgi:hypothetical protein
MSCLLIARSRGSARRAINEPTWLPAAGMPRAARACCVTRALFRADSCRQQPETSTEQAAKWALGYSLQCGSLWLARRMKRWQFYPRC